MLFLVLGRVVSFVFVNYVTHYAMLHQLVLEPSFFLIMARRRAHGGGNRHATIGDVYECEETIRDEQLAARLQRLEEQIDRFGD